MARYSITCMGSHTEILHLPDHVFEHEIVTVQLFEKILTG
jgi:hypothetical protein